MKEIARHTAGKVYLLLLVLSVIDFIVLMAAYGYRIAAKAAEDYMLGGRTIGVVVMFIWGSVVGFAGLYMFLGPRLWALAKATRFLSPVEVVAERYRSPGLRLILSLSILAFVIPYVGIQPLGVGAGFEALTGLRAIWGAIYTTVILVVLVLLGGMRIVAWVNIFLAVVYMSALLGSLVWAVNAIFPTGGLTEAVSIPAVVRPEMLPSPGPVGRYSPVVLGGTFVVALLAFSWPQVAIGCMTARGKKLFKQFPLLIFVIGGLFFYILLFIWGSIVAPVAMPFAELEAPAAEKDVSLQTEADRLMQTITDPASAAMVRGLRAAGDHRRGGEYCGGSDDDLRRDCKP